MKKKFPKMLTKKFAKSPVSDDVQFMFNGKRFRGIIDDGLCSTCNRSYKDHPNEVCKYTF